MTLKELECNKQAKIVSIDAEGALLQKLSDMGFLPGREVSMVRFSPFYDPIEVNIFGYNIGIRKNEAAFVKVEIAQ